MPFIFFYPLASYLLCVRNDFLTLLRVGIQWTFIHGEQKEKFPPLLKASIYVLKHFAFLFNIIYMNMPHHDHHHLVTLLSLAPCESFLHIVNTLNTSHNCHLHFADIGDTFCRWNQWGHQQWPQARSWLAILPRFFISEHWLGLHQLMVWRMSYLMQTSRMKETWARLQ